MKKYVEWINTKLWEITMYTYCTYFADQQWKSNLNLLYNQISTMKLKRQY